MNSKLSELLPAFCSYITTQGKRVETARNYKLYLNRFIDFTGDITLSELTPQIINSFQTHISKNNLAPATMAYHSVAIRSFLVYLSRMGYQVNPFIVSIPKVEQQEREYLTEDEMKRILEVAHNPREKAVLQILCTTGVRISELLQLTTSDIKDNRQATIRGKGSKLRVVFFTPECYEAVRRYILKEKVAGLLFPITPRTIQRMVATVGKKAGIAKHVHPHIFRHGVASKLLSNGTDLRHVQQILGHSNPTTTAIYTHTTNTDLQKVFDLANDPITDGEVTSQKVNSDYVLVSKEYLNSMNRLLSQILSSQEELAERLDNR